MNAISLTIRNASSATRKLIADQVWQYDNWDGGLVEEAVKAAEAGRPAYWTTQRYSNQAAQLFAVICNREGLRSALASLRPANVTHETATALVDSLVALNGAAADAITYWKEQAPWIDGGEKLEAAE